MARRRRYRGFGALTPEQEARKQELQRIWRRDSGATPEQRKAAVAEWDILVRRGHLASPVEILARDAASQEILRAEAARSLRASMLTAKDVEEIEKAWEKAGGFPQSPSQFPTLVESIQRRRQRERSQKFAAWKREAAETQRLREAYAPQQQQQAVFMAKRLEPSPDVARAILARNFADRASGMLERVEAQSPNDCGRLVTAYFNARNIMGMAEAHAIPEISRFSRERELQVPALEKARKLLKKFGGVFDLHDSTTGQYKQSREGLIHKACRFLPRKQEQSILMLKEAYSRELAKYAERTVPVEQMRFTKARR